MSYLGTLDYAVIAGYLLILLAMGWFLKNAASASLEDYFIGDRKIPWWALGITGMSSFLDMTGTMIITSFLFMLGPRGLFIEFRGGAVLVLAFMMLWTGKWHRRSQCITGAEWMIFRFGDGAGGRFAQLVSVLSGVVGTVGMLAYLMKGAGLFLSMFMPFTPFWCSVIMIGVATVYTVMSGFYGVVFTDLFQSVCIMAAVIMVSVLAVLKVGGADELSALALQVTGNREWLSAMPRWETTMPAGYEAYRHLIMFAMFYLLRNVFGGLGSGGDPKYFGARSDRECGTLTLLWTATMTFRWPMMMGFAVLGLYLVRDLFPDMGAIGASVAAVKDFVPNVREAQWSELVSAIAYQPGKYDPQLVARLGELLGDDWGRKLLLTSFHGTINPEQILPAVLLYDIPLGFRGLMLVALVAAAMSTFDATVNATTGLLTRDVYQKFIRPRAANSELIYASWVFTVSQVVIAMFFAYSIKSINDIWGWIIMGLGGGLMIPGVLRLYWWRFNGGGFAIGTGVGLTAAVLQKFYYPGLDERLQFLFLGCIGLTATVIGTFITKPTDRAVLEHFYRTTRPFGFWGPLKSILPADVRLRMEDEHRRDLMALPFALVCQVCLFLMPMTLIIRNFTAFGVTAAIFLACGLVLYLVWFRHLPAHNYE